MKAKRTFLMLGIAAMLASCSSDDVLQGTNESANNVVTFTATLDNGMKTRATDYGDDGIGMVGCAIVEVYSDSAATQKVGERVTVYKGADGTFTFSIPNLNAGQKYTFLFWAYNHHAYELNVNDLKNIQIKRSPYYFNYAPFSLATTLTPEEISQSGVQLKHAATRITMQTTADMTTSDEIFLYVPVYSSFNVLTNSATGTSSELRVRGYGDFSAGDIVRSAYFFGAQEGTQTVSIEYNGRPTKKELTNVPLNPNKHVILKGDYTQIGLTSASFSVTLDTGWGEQNNDF